MANAAHTTADINNSRHDSNSSEHKVRRTSGFHAFGSLGGGFLSAVI